MIETDQEGVIVVSKVLLLPLLQIPSGHHQVADAVSRWLSTNLPDLEVEKIEILSSMNAHLEKMVSQAYLKWIDHFPRVYDWLYRQLSYQPSRVTRDHKGYEWLFLATMRKIITESKPDVIICTHALPSYLCSRLKMLGQIEQSIVNIYTDFFVNQLWGVDGVDLHFAPSYQVKENLVIQGVRESTIFVTGIPVDSIFHQVIDRDQVDREQKQVLIAGGSIGVGFEAQYIERMILEDQIHFYVLCGRNEQLYRELQRLNREHIHPLSYIYCRTEMKNLYDQMDAIVTKPGGVTVSEALHTELPIFIHSALPGQEEINRDYLFQQQMAYPIDLNLPLGDQLSSRLADLEQSNMLKQRMVEYRSSLEWEKALQVLMSYL